eukprot:TRINITY_DN114_c4_g1_i1.p1 TRINITY_DN114_c4_g1~~TRINITY_DN114_c4_g1_i1.p1  ORF type:complete len:200 (+),score=81.59 TRINITY_DN114_c4_g1_i1:104-703(+)
MITTQEAESLLVLLGAPNQKAIQQLILAVFSSSRISTSFSLDFVNELSTSFKSDPETIQKLLAALVSLINKSIYEYLPADQMLVKLFPNGFHDNLKQLLVKIISHYLSQWRRETLISHNFLASLKSIDWRIDIKSASNHIHQISIPTVIVQLQIVEPTTRTDVEPTLRTVTFELDSITLQTMLDGLGKIRAQLTSIKQQ